MTDEQRAKRNEYMRNYYKNLSRYQKEKRRIKNLEKKKQKYHDKTPKEKAKRKEANREHYLKNIDKIRAYAKAYRQKQKEKKCLQNEKEKN
jgi:chromatin segregation and condensation protein Rec8/ScpA/Scc1 (kleisin family)